MMIKLAVHGTATALATRTLAALAMALAAVLISQAGDARAQESDDPRSDPPRFTRAFVAQATVRYELNGLTDTIAHYNSAESIDGQWYVFIFDESDVLIAHAPDPDLVGRHSSDVRGPKGYPSGDSVVAVAKANPEGAWLEYTFPNPATGDLETKHSWVVMHDGLVFGSGWYEPGPSRSRPDEFTQELSLPKLSISTRRSDGTAPSPTTTALRASTASGTCSSLTRATCS